MSVGPAPASRKQAARTWIEVPWEFFSTSERKEQKQKFPIGPGFAMWPHKETYAAQCTYNVVYVLLRKGETPRDPFWVTDWAKHNGMPYHFQEEG